MKAAFALLCLALAASTVQSRIVIVQLQAVFHTDSWCQDHHSGEGPSTCIMNSGCCYDGRIGICHSCDAHSDEWCGTYGGNEVKSCVGYAGCTFSYDDPNDPKCVSAGPRGLRGRPPHLRGEDGPAHGGGRRGHGAGGGGAEQEESDGCREARGERRPAL